MSIGGSEGAGHAIICAMRGEQSCGEGVYTKDVSASGPLNLCDLAHVQPFTLPLGYSAGPRDLDGEPDCQSSLEACCALSPEDHVEVFATGL